MFELFIAKRIYKKKSKQYGDAPPAVRIAVAGIALGLTVMILSVAIVIGFKREVRQQVVGFGSHIQVTNFDRNASFETIPIALSDTLLDSLSLCPNIKHVQIFATKPGILKTETDFQGIILKGVGKSYDWSFFKEKIVEGSLIDLSSEKATTEVLISKYLSNLLNLHVGDKFLTYFVQDNIRARKFTIKGIYSTGFMDYDKMFVLADIRHIQKINKWDKDQVSGVELLVNNYEDLDETSENIYYYLANRHDREGNTYFSRSIKDLNPVIFNWLEVLDVNVIMILVLMMAVAGFTMISGLLIIILERTQMIGILKALGENNKNIRRIFFSVALFLIGKGMLWGNVIGLILCVIQSHYHLLKLDATVYYIDFVPIELSLGAWFLLNIGAFSVAMLMMLAPTTLISRINPARSIRFE